MTRESDDVRPVSSWTLLTSHGLALLYVAEHPDATIREIAAALALTERRVADLIRDLAAEGFIVVRRKGRRNLYTLNRDARFRHPVIADIPFRAFVDLWRRSRRQTHASSAWRRPPPRTEYLD